MEVKVEASQVAKILNLRNSQPCKISAVVQFSSVCGSNSFRLLTRISEFVLDSSCLSQLDDVGVFSLYK